MKFQRKWIIYIIVLLPLLGLSLFLFTLLSRHRDYEQVTIPAGGYEIKGYLSQGTSADGPWIVFGHGNRKEGSAAELYQSILNNIETEATVLAIDFRGFGGSSEAGMAESEDIIDRTGDIEAAIAYLKIQLNAKDERIILIGHSMGAAQVMKIANEGKYGLAIPIGLGDWDLVLTHPEKINAYIEKFYQNTGVKVKMEDLRREAMSQTPQSLFSDCPETPVALFFASREENRQTLAPYYQAAYDRCGEQVRIVTIFSSDHMYGTELFSLPGPVRKLISKFEISLLMFNLNQVISRVS